MDGVMVGQLISGSALAAVNLAQPLILNYQIWFFLFGMGGSALAAICKGEQNEEKANKVFTLSLLFMLSISLLFSLLGLLFLDGLAGLLCHNETLYPLLKSYLRVLLLGAPFLVMVPGLVYFVRVDGFPELSGRVLLVANAANLVLDFVYIRLLGLGMAGASLATVSGYLLGAGCFVFYLKSKQRRMRMVPLQNGDRKLVKEIVNSGLSGAVNTALLSVKTLVLNSIILAVGGAGGMAVFTVCSYLICFVSMFNAGAAETMVPLAGMLYGEKDWRGIRYVVQHTLLVSVAASASCFAACLLLPKQILWLFGVTGVQQMEQGVGALRLFSFSLVLMGVAYCMMYYYQTIKHRNLSLIITLMRGFVYIIPLALLFSFMFGQTGVYISYVLSELLTLITAFCLCLLAVKRSVGRYSGLLLAEPEAADTCVSSITVQGTAEDAVEASKTLIRFGQQQGLSAKQSNLLGLAAEEAALAIAQKNRRARPLTIDILCRLSKEKCLLRFRDNGLPFTPSSLQIAHENSEYDNLTMLTTIAQRVDYTAVMGLNNTIVELKGKEW